MAAVRVNCPMFSAQNRRIVVAKEKPESELRRLRVEQDKTRRDEVFGGLSPAERAEYEKKANRIRTLESQIQASAVAKKSSQNATATRRRQSKRKY